MGNDSGAKFTLTLQSSSNTPRLAKFDGTKLFTEELPEIVVGSALKALPEPKRVSAIGSIVLNGTSIIGAVDLVEDIPIPGLPVDPKYTLFSKPIGSVGAFFFKLEFGSEISEEVSVEVAVVPDAPGVVAPEEVPL